MKIVFPGIMYVFDTDCDKVNSVIIENQDLMAQLLTDLQSQIRGDEGATVVSEQDKPVLMNKRVELLSQFFPFSINQKSLLSKIASEMERIAIHDNYEKTMEFLCRVEAYLLDLSMNLVGDIQFDKIDVSNIIKSAGMSVRDEYDSLVESIVDYMELVREYDKDKLFILLNIRSFVKDEDMETFFDTILRHQYHVILLENCERSILKHEKRYIIDVDLCEIS